MYRVLVFGMTENPGGVESFLRNYISELMKEDMDFDFLCNFPEPMAYETEMKLLGCGVIHITARSQNYRKYKKEIGAFFEKHAREYDCIWVNVSSLANIDYLKLAYKYKIPKRIIHSHNSRNMDSRLRGVLHHWNKLWISLWATDFWACSEEAGRWFYRKSLLRKMLIVHNAISVEKMRFRQEAREKYRTMLGGQDNYVLGNIGRLHFQKNQEFLLKIFSVAVSQYPEMKLIIIGQGEDETKLKKTARELNIEKQVYFAGVQSDISGWLSTMDLFVFPSLFEGTPIAALEAQANGVPVLASDTAVRQACIMNENCMTLSLKEPVEKWVDAILDTVRNSERISYHLTMSHFKEKGYDIHTEVKRVEQFLHYRKK